MAKKSKTKKANTKKKLSNANINTSVEPEMPELVAAMLKIAQRLENVENKIEQVLSQLPGKVYPRPNAPQVVLPPSPAQNNLVSRPPQVSHSGSSSPSHHNHQAHHKSNHSSRMLYKTVCADCHKGCEVPFKPTGERPVYCKDCFAKRKSKSGNHSSHKQFESNPQPMRERLVKVTPNGVGRVTISEMVPTAHHRENSSARPKGHKPARRR